MSEKLMDCDPTRTDDMYSLLLSKSEFLTSTVSRSCGDDGTFENVTVHDGALLAELEQTPIIVSEMCDTSWNIPAKQFAHEEAPETFENFPHSHCVHDDAPVPE